MWGAAMVKIFEKGDACSYKLRGEAQIHAWQISKMFRDRALYILGTAELKNCTSKSLLVGKNLIKLN